MSPVGCILSFPGSVGCSHIRRPRPRHADYTKPVPAVKSCEKDTRGARPRERHPTRHPTPDTRHPTRDTLSFTGGGPSGRPGHPTGETWSKAGFSVQCSGKCPETRTLNTEYPRSLTGEALAVGRGIPSQSQSGGGGECEGCASCELCQRRFDSLRIRTMVGHKWRSCARTAWVHSLCPLKRTRCRRFGIAPGGRLATVAGLPRQGSKILRREKRRCLGNLGS